MRTRIAGLLAGTALLVAAPVGSAPGAGPGHAESAGGAPVKAARACGRIRARGHRYRVVGRRHVRCRKARSVLRRFLRGGGRMHGDPNGPYAQRYWALGRWRCGYGAGGAGCRRRKPRARIYAYGL